MPNDAAVYENIVALSRPRDINIDTPQTPVSQQTTGIVYGKDEEERRTDAANTVPRLVCPNCVAIVTRLDVVNQYTKADGSIVRTIPPCPIVNVGMQPFFYSCRPCGCRISGDWASAWAGEMNRRLEGSPPRPVALAGPKVRAARLKQYERALVQLRTCADSTDIPRASREAAEIWAIIVADQIQRYCPGGHNRAGATTMPVPEPVAGTGEQAEIARQFDPLATAASDAMAIEYPVGYPMPKKDTEPVQFIDPVAEQANRPAGVSEVMRRYNERLASRLLADRVRGPEAEVTTINEGVTRARWGGSSLLDQPTTQAMLTQFGLVHADLKAAHDYLVKTPATKHVLGSTLAPEHQTVTYIAYMFGDILENLKEYALGQRFYLSRDAMSCVRALVEAKAITPTLEPLPLPTAPPKPVAGPLPVAPPGGTARRTRRRTIRRLEE